MPSPGRPKGKPLGDTCSRHIYMPKANVHLMDRVAKAQGMSWSGWARARLTEIARKEAKAIKKEMAP